MMKNRKFSVIIAVLLVACLALAGCGQKGNQEGSTTNGTSETQTTENSSEVKEQDDQNSNASIPTDYSSLTEEEIERAIGNKPEQDDSDNSKDLMNWYYKRDKYISQNAYNSSDGMYHYYIGGLELICETNVWDYIYEDGGYYVYNFSKFASDIGLSPIRMIDENQYINEMYADYVDKISIPNGARFCTVTSGEVYNAYNSTVINVIGGRSFASSNIAEYAPYDNVVYRIGNGQKTWREAMSLSSIVTCTYILECSAKGNAPDSIMQFFDSWYDAGDKHYVIPK